MKRQQHAFRPSVGDQVRLEDRVVPASAFFSFGFQNLAAFAPPVKSAQITAAGISAHYHGLQSQTNREARLLRADVNDGTLADWSEAAGAIQDFVLDRAPRVINRVQDLVVRRHPFRFQNITPTIDNINNAYLDSVAGFDPADVTTQAEFNALVSQLNRLARQASSRSQQAVFSGGLRPRSFSDIF